jgi:hypothetical protein
MELSNDGRQAWWADSPDVAGFSAAGASIEELVEVAEHALQDIAADLAEDMTPDWHFDGGIEMNYGPIRTSELDKSDSAPAADVRQVQRVPAGAV